MPWMTRTGEAITELTADMLAQFRGCSPWEPCFGGCYTAAEDTLKRTYAEFWTAERWQLIEQELKDALAWAKRQRWQIWTAG